MPSIQFQPLVSLPLWLALAVGGAALLAWYGSRRPGAMSRRRWLAALALAGLGMLLVFAILLNPIALSPVPPPEGKPLLTILADRSASMAVTDQAEGHSRFRTASAVASKLERELSQSFDVQVRTFAERTTSVSIGQLSDLKPDGQISDLATAIAESLDGSRTQGQALLLLSDGIHNASGGVEHVLDVVRTSHAMSAPIYASTIGGQTVIDDLELSLARQQELSFVGQKAPIRAMLKQRGRLTGEAEVELLDDAGQVVEKKQVMLPANGTAQAVFYVSQRTTGLHRYQVRMEPLSREATADNNTSTFLLRTVDRPVRVLLLEGKPYWDAKFLMRTLAHDEALEIDAVVRVADGRFLQRSVRTANRESDNSDGQSDAASVNNTDTRGRRTEITEVLRAQPSLLSTGEKLSEYQIVVLGRDAESFLTAEVLERLGTWLSRDGGSLVCFRGAPVATLNQKLARLMPVRWAPSPESRFRMQVTSRGQDLSWISAAPGSGDALARLPSLATSARLQHPTPLAVVVAESPGQAQPVVSYQPYGCGRVVAIEGAGMWRWAFLSPDHQQAEPIYDGLWQGLMRWLVASGGLAPGQRLALRTEKVSFFSEEPAVATLLLRESEFTGELPRIELQRDGAVVGSFAPVPLGDEPGVFRVSFGPCPTGTYRASVAGSQAKDMGATVAFDVRPNFTEQLDTASRSDILNQIAEKSGGAMLQEVSAAEIERRFREHLARNRPVQFRETTLWDRWWVLALVVGLWASAWGLRRQKGLI
jgi:hypothetical protein